MTLQCKYCQRESNNLHRDHVVPRSRGGPDNATNIVMACQECNFAKRDKLASEWLGDKCPEEIQRIESAVNEKLQKDFKKRDARKREPAIPKEPTLFVFRVTEKGSVDFIGEVLEEREDVFRVEVLDAVMATGCGLWCLSGQIEDLPKEQCRMYNDRAACLESALRINNRIYEVYR